jgi:uncharacterized protein YndB with AHSA1/START domain
MDPAVERELVVPESPEEVWRSLSEPDWLGEDAYIELEPAGEVHAGDRSGFVEEVDEPSRLVFWWGEEGGESTRVEIELEEADEGTRVLVVESRPLAILDARGVDLATELGVSFPSGPQMSAGPMLLAR